TSADGCCLRVRRPGKASSVLMGLLLLRRWLPRDLDSEGGARPGLARHPDGPSVGGDDLTGDVQAEPEPAIGVRGDSSLEAIEDPGELVLLDANAVVLHREEGAVPVRAGAHHDGLAAAILDGVGDEVRHHLLEAQAIPSARHRTVMAELESAA